MARHRADPVKARDAVRSVEAWLRDDTSPAPSRADLAAAVRLTARTLAEQAPGASVEVRIPPFVAVQCISGPRHTTQCGRGRSANMAVGGHRTAGGHRRQCHRGAASVRLAGRRDPVLATAGGLGRLDQRRKPGPKGRIDLPIPVDGRYLPAPGATAARASGAGQLVSFVTYVTAGALWERLTRKSGR